MRMRGAGSLQGRQLPYVRIFVAAQNAHTTVFSYCPSVSGSASHSLSVRLGKYLVKRKFSKKFYYVFDAF